MHVINLYLSTTLDMEKAFSSIFTTNKKRTAMPNVPSGLIGLISAIFYQDLELQFEKFKIVRKDDGSITVKVLKDVSQHGTAQVQKLKILIAISRVHLTALLLLVNPRKRIMKN